MEKPLGTDRDMDRPGTGAVGYGDLGPQVGNEEPWLPGAEPGDELPDKAAVEGQKAALENIREVGQLAVPPPEVSRIHCVSIVGQVEGHILLPPRNKTTKYEHIIPQLVAVEQSPEIDGVLIILNTVGGDIEAGLAIAEMIKGLSKPSVSLVLGGGHSIGAPIAVAADYSFIAESATITIHPIRLTGLVVGVPQTYEYLDKMQDRVVRFIVENSSITEGRLRELMFRTGDLMRDIGTVLIGREAVRVGLINEVGGLARALAKLEEMMDARTGEGRTNERPAPTVWPLIPPQVQAPSPQPGGPSPGGGVGQ